MRTGASSCRFPLPLFSSFSFSPSLVQSLFCSLIHTHTHNSFSLSLCLFHSMTCIGHTLFSCTISCNYDDDDDYPLFFPFSLLLLLSSFLPLSDPPFLPFSFRRSFSVPLVMILPFRRLLFIVAFSYHFPMPFPIFIARTRSIRKMHSMIIRDFTFAKIFRNS